jgi:uncharacterized protein YegJ (DUF2314 family)
MKHKLASLEEDSWELESGVKRHLEFPDSFWIPSQEARNHVTPGQAVKLIFNIETVDDTGNPEINCERMWVLVKTKIEDLYCGTLENQPECTADMKKGLEVYFREEHIIDIINMS